MDKRDKDIQLLADILKGITENKIKENAKKERDKS